jgi:hypothetical protein
MTIEYYKRLLLDELPVDVRKLVLAAVRTLMDRGPHGLVEDGVAPLEAEPSMVENLSDYPGRLVEPPSTAELWGHADSEGIWTIDLPLHDDRDGRMDLFIFLTIDPQRGKVVLRGLYTP